MKTDEEIRNLLNRNKSKIVLLRHIVDFEKWFEPELFPQMENPFFKKHSKTFINSISIDFGFEFLSSLAYPKRIIFKNNISIIIPIIDIIPDEKDFDFRVSNSHISLKFKDPSIEEKYYKSIEKLGFFPKSIDLRRVSFF